MNQSSSFFGNISNREEYSTKQVYILVLLFILYGTISFVAVFGNGLIIYSVIINKSLQSVTNYFICNLAAADLIIGLLVAPFQVFCTLFSILFN
jgi:hypothetical protein